MAALLPFFAFYLEGEGCSGRTTTDNLGNLFYKCLQSNRWDLENRGYVQLHDQEVPHSTLPVAIVENIVKAEVENKGNVAKSRRLTEVLTPEGVVDKHEGSAWEVLREFADRWTTTKTNRGDYTTGTVANSGAGFTLGFSEADEFNPANWHRDDITVTAWGTRTRNYYDEELGLKMTETRSVVGHGTALPTSTPGAFYSQQQVDAGRDILTTIGIDGYSETKFDRTTYQTKQFTFPALLASWDGDETHDPVVPDWVDGHGWLSSAFEEGNARSVFQITIFTREAWTEGVLAEVNETLITASDAATLFASSPSGSFGSGTDLGTSTTRARIFNPRPRDLVYNGLMFEFHVQNVLCDGTTITATSSSDDEYYGPSKVEAFSFPSSNISATAYIALIDSKVCVEDTITPWKFGLYMRRRQYIKLK